MDFLSIISIFTAVSFIYFGISCLTTHYMKSEFIRYGLAKQRVLTGSLQLIGATGILIGVWGSPFLAFFSSCGLFLLMLAGYSVRLKIKDSFLRSLPALIFAILCIYLSYRYYALWQLEVIR
ncbi:DoxX family protein [Sungkyunkwania multivorans]|uniref:DoxX family protein n=1 Tax=Sungkyunkwania multivorans TaxID=1173618 RepID=A0ABW3CZD6_9FLAO